MSGFVYLIRNKDLYKIGITQNFQQRMNQLSPDEIVSKLETNNYKELEKQLHSQFKSVRIPQTEYFRLTESQLENCKAALKDGSQEGKYPNWDTEYDPKEVVREIEPIIDYLIVPIASVAAPVFIAGGFLDVLFGHHAGFYIPITNVYFIVLFLASLIQGFSQLLSERRINDVFPCATYFIIILWVIISYLGLGYIPIN